MTIYKLPECTPVSALPAGAAVALGNFDGVHRGHQRLFDAARGLADEGKCSCSCAWTFTSPAKISPILCLTDMNAKLRLFAQYGLDYAVFEDFELVKNMPCREFVAEYLVEVLGAGYTVCGFNFRFGKGGAGDSALLSATMAELGKGCHVVPAVIHEGLVVSSTEVRKRVECGDMSGAADLLGHPFSIKFPVIHGQKLGRTIGIPTINQSFPEGHIVPRQGIYACSCYVNGEIYLGVANVGVRPTVSDGKTVNCETHIINYSGDLYGKEIEVEFYERLREEMKFDSVDALRRQIRIDIAECLDYFCTMYG
ncbi:MAG: riboflavin biosynthesis protein RibF [Clostridia bacterium]|nr:riboflavin biosynthesis protein RibF [Clostridia bacterium]